MNCRKCGSRIREGQKFCIECGAAVAQPEQSTKKTVSQNHGEQKKEKLVTCYDVLEVIPTASEEMIHISYQTLSMKYDPSRYSGDKGFAEHKMQMINKAYGILSDPETRHKYDLYLQRQYTEVSSIQQPTAAKKCLSCGHDVVIYPKPAHDNDVYNEILRTDRNRVSHTYRKRPLTLIIILICVSVLFLLSLICYFTLRIIMQKDYPVVTDSINASTHWIEEEYLSPTENELNLETTVSTIVTETEIETPAESRYISRSRKVAEIEYTEYLKQEDIRQFTQKANANNITLEMLNRQPDYYTGMEVYFGGTVLQAIYNADDPQRVDLRIKEKLANSSQNVIYVSYT